MSRRYFWLAALLILMACGGDRGPVFLRLGLLGDVMLGRGVAAAHREGGWDHALADLPGKIRSAHFTLANLEAPLLDEPTEEMATNDENRRGYRLFAPVESVAALTAGGIDVVSLVNNHSGDGGPAGRQITRDVLGRAGISTISETGQPVWIRSPGVNCAIYAWEDVSEGIPLEDAVQVVFNTSAQGACVIVSLHWGMEYQAGPQSRQKRIAQQFADAGAWLIWGHHPHVVQAVDWLQGKDRPRRTLVLYSLGNALFDQVVPADSRRSAGVLVYISNDRIAHVEAYPFEIDLRRGKVSEASSEKARITKNRLGKFIEN